MVAGAGSAGGSEILSTPCAPQHPVSIFEIHGNKDFYGGSCGGQTESDAECPDGFGTTGYEPSVEQVDEQWRGIDGCPATGATQSFGTIAEQTWGPCEGESGVRLDTNEGGKHCWPTPTTCGDFSASEAFWDFLSAHRLASAPPGKGSPSPQPASPERPRGPRTPDAWCRICVADV